MPACHELKDVQDITDGFRPEEIDPVMFGRIIARCGDFNTVNRLDGGDDFFHAGIVQRDQAELLLDERTGIDLFDSDIAGDGIIDGFLVGNQAQKRCPSLTQKAHGTSFEDHICEGASLR